MSNREKALDKAKELTLSEEELKLRRRFVEAQDRIITPKCYRVTVAPARE